MENSEESMISTKNRDCVKNTTQKAINKIYNLGLSTVSEWYKILLDSDYYIMEIS
jgi:hypothetical protein